MIKGGLVCTVKNDKMSTVAAKDLQGITVKEYTEPNISFRKILTLSMDNQKGDSGDSIEDFVNILKSHGIEIMSLIGLLFNNNSIDNKMPLIEKMLTDNGIEVNQSLRNIILKFIENPELLLEVTEDFSQFNRLSGEMSQVTNSEFQKRQSEDVHNDDKITAKGTDMPSDSVIRLDKDILDAEGQQTPKVHIEIKGNQQNEKSEILLHQGTKEIFLEDIKGENKKQGETQYKGIFGGDRVLKVVQDFIQDFKAVIDDKTAPIVNVLKNQGNILQQSQESVLPVKAQDVISQIVNGARVSIDMGASKYSADIKLKPDYLGNISLKIEIDKGVMIAKFEVQNYQVKQIIESNLVQLRDALQSQGINVQNINVTVDTGMGGQLAQDHGNNQWKETGRYRFNEGKVAARNFDDMVIAFKGESGINYLV
ncbi:hook-length control protein FliK [Caldanaerobius fijiensis DSM 17918]|uniref:Hook-length control protein FliK n=1 Tax=Caldanaerobius fijiensis DSM 17918 TaxID=1121256 RepID=A0A1M4XNR7_9THEO|nr:flagellar hook-length control protein FliK [Caldanaerobius fijiensis]SHE94862.1 hook-length control protein FliK [Caldanaerobius fijiensis DSM 17918]